jgi:UDP-3-O-[3-hydroxymyristoyl] N-acetylglucosamine deacetylase
MMVLANGKSAIKIVQSQILQKTLRRSVVVTGRTLHTGELAEVVIEPAPENYGIRFCHYALRADRGESQFFYAGDSTSSAKINDGRILCIEHMMSSLHGLGITNAHIRCTEGAEVPIRDGSANDIVAEIMDAGWVEQRLVSACAAVRSTIFYTDKHERRSIIARPWDGFLVDASISFPRPIGKQVYSIEITPDSYLREIASARTFLQQSTEIVTLAEVRDKRLLGLDVDRLDACQALVYDSFNYISTLRFSTEAVRHKILDFIGDIYTLGVPVRGRFTLVRPGHSFTLKFCQFLLDMLTTSGSSSARLKGV